MSWRVFEHILNCVIGK